MDNDVLLYLLRFLVICILAIAAIVAAGFGVVWVITAVVLGVFETRRARREREAFPGPDDEDALDISLL